MSLRSRLREKELREAKIFNSGQLKPPEESKFNWGGFRPQVLIDAWEQLVRQKFCSRMVDEGTVKYSKAE
jgi:hypothetical protein